MELAILFLDIFSRMLKKKPSSELRILTFYIIYGSV